MKILVVDDSMTIRIQLDKTLKSSKKGYQVYQAASGLEALHLLKEVPDIGIVISDLNMPEMDGLTLVEFVKKEEKLQNLEIVLLTTETCPKTRLKAKEVGVTAWIPKPASPPLLLRMIEKIVDKISFKKSSLLSM